MTSAETQNGHPAPGRLTAYHAGELPPAEVEAIQDHLAHCAECTRALLALPHFYAEMEAPELAERPDPGAEASWQALRARLPTPLVPPGVPRASGGEARPEDDRGLRAESRRLLPRSYALAAGLALGLLGLSLWLAFQAGMRSAPPLAVSLPGEEVTRSGGGGAPLSVHLATGS